VAKSIANFPVLQLSDMLFVNRVDNGKSGTIFGRTERNQDGFGVINPFDLEA